MRIISVNTNGIRAAARKGFFEWLKVVDADVICIQETKAQEGQLIDPIFSPEGYHAYYHDAEKKGYSGVAIYCKQKPKKVQMGIGWEDMDSEGRYLQVDFENTSVISLYMPSGSSKEERQDFKYDLMYRFSPYMKKLLKKKREYIICGDWNIAHKVIDIKNAKANEKNSGFLPEERAWMDTLFDDLGWVDAFRVVNKEPHQYTWWSNRGQAWANNTGWRIDYQIITPGLKDRVKNTEIYKEERFSDHAPLIIDYSGDL
ncbi:MAG: exodeoxyribonuclease III [Gammaproteobacteria bacterium]|nr:exodeoxyribonuclease III [Gammaproteobacteria bacterium]